MSKRRLCPIPMELTIPLVQGSQNGTRAWKNARTDYVGSAATIVSHRLLGLPSLESTRGKKNPNLSRKVS